MYELLAVVLFFARVLALVFVSYYFKTMAFLDNTNRLAYIPHI